ncbi:MAG: hypothetical protein JOZ99_12075 [Actinobacteria bacterium]|nr:hypothetical protein [Actinomycetota bacterium]
MIQKGGGYIPATGWEVAMLFDVLVALLITALAIVLGITVHPLLFFIIVLAIVYFVARTRTGTRAHGL